MTLFKNKRDGKLYLMSKNNPGGRYTGAWIEAKLYTNQYSVWFKVPNYRLKDYEPVTEL